jgi:hypothetical protein
MVEENALELPFHSLRCRNEEVIMMRLFEWQHYLCSGNLRSGQSIHIGAMPNVVGIEVSFELASRHCSTDDHLDYYFHIPRGHFALTTSKE